MRIRASWWRVVSLALVLVLAVPWGVWADNVQDDVAGSGSTTIDVGDTATISYWIVGNGSDGCNVDASNPATVTINIDAEDDEVGTDPDPAELTFTKCREGAVVNAQSVDFTGLKAGSYAITVSVTGGKAGNNGWNTGPAASTLIVEATADTTPPVVSYTLTPAAPDGSNGWYVSDVLVDWTVTDPESAITSTSGCDDVTVSADTTGVTYTCSATSAGGTTSVTTVTIKRDATAPTISASLDKSPAASGWFNSSTGAPTVSFTCSDATSGLAGDCPASYLFGEGENQSYSQTIYDNAGNSASAGVTDVDVDLTAPTFGTCPTGGPFYLGSGMQAVGPISASDALSGLDSAASTLSGSVDTSTIGAKDVTFTAYDNAGNSNTKTCTYNVIFLFSGFFKPIDNGMLNVVKAGSAVPVKFSLDGYQGMGIIATGYPKVWTIACPGGEPEAPVEETVTAGQSSLSYDAIEDQYVYVWKTSKAWAGTCKQLEVKLIDGTSHFADFKLK